MWNISELKERGYAIPYYNCANAELYKVIRDEYGTVTLED